MGEEISWEILHKRSGGYINEERTTVTNKVRRVAEWDHAANEEACFAIQPNWIALTFYDYVKPELSGRARFMSQELTGIHHYQRSLSAPIKFVGTKFGQIVELNNREQAIVREGVL